MKIQVKLALLPYLKKPPPFQKSELDFCPGFCTAVLVMALTAMDNLSCSFSFPKGCTQQSMLLPGIAIQPSCSSCSHTVPHELCFMSMQLMSYSLALGFSLWNFSSSSRYVSPRSDLISDQYGHPLFSEQQYLTLRCYNKLSFFRYQVVLIFSCLLELQPTKLK